MTREPWDAKARVSLDKPDPGLDPNAFSVVASTLTILTVLSPTNAAPLDGVFAVAASAGSESAPVQSNPNAKPGFSYGFAHTAPLASFGAPHHGHRQGTNDADAEGYLATQYHTQSNVGDAAFGYAHPGQAHASIRDANGGVTGSYSYISPEGHPIHVLYVADAAGFRVISNALPDANGDIPLHAQAALPTPVQETPEVQAAREEHMRLFAAIKSSRQPQQS
ncbi:unnamed protein product [Notodromas monacha]|uniref:Cuticle protein n=1 Tax=Notodromas monacha TaxID=399045 RepID=A0A7R9BYR8_9CRUS|nr:unnamed protein product [Notodromas monacha]CAG0923306.1 unnamed protein product [Notodromas monacha]